MKKLIASLLLLISANAFSQSLGIVNTAVTIGQISRNDARALYLMKERRWDDGQPVILFKLPTTSRIHRSFVREVLGMSVSQYTREWDRIVNAGLSTNVQLVTTATEMFLRVANTSNALGYIDSDHMIVNMGDRDVKTLRITN